MNEKGLLSSGSPIGSHWQGGETGRKRGGPAHVNSACHGVT